MIHVYRSSRKIVLAACLTVMMGSASAATLNLANSPLFTAVSVKPNVFFVLDDSESMESDMLTKDYSNGGLMSIDSSNYRFVHYMNPSYVAGSMLPLPSQESVDAYNMSHMMSKLHSDSDGVWRGRCKDFNLLYYDPDISYGAWTGLDTDGNAYATITDPTSVPIDPYAGAGGTHVDLTQNYAYNTDVPMGMMGSTTVSVSDYYIPRYYTWRDDNSDGEVGSSEAHRLVEIRTGGTCATGATCPTSFTRAVTRTDCTVSGSSATCTAAQELNNFATWWAYHRTRDKVMKAALSSVIGNGTDLRMGMSTIHNNPNMRAEVAAMNDNYSTGNKLALMNKMFTYKGSAPGTPLKAGLERAGNYFACNTAAETTSDTHYTYYPYAGTASSVTQSNNLFGNTNCPIETAANGGACQQNFAVLLTDGYGSSHASVHTWSGTPTRSGDSDFSAVVSGAANNVQLYNDPFTTSSSRNEDSNSASAFDGGAYADSYSDTLADVAMYFYKTDLSGLSNEVPTQTGVDENDAQHLVTYAVSLGLNGTLSAMPADPSASFTWPDPSASAQAQLDDLRHAAYNGRGAYFSAKNPGELSTALDSAITAISDRTGAAAAVAFNTTTLSTDSHVYLALFNSTRWSGDLKAYPLDPNTGIISSTKAWSAADQLDAMTYTSRDIFTYNPSTRAGLAFSSYAGLTATQQADLSTDSTGTTDGLGSARFDYIRGSRSDEGSGNYFRRRDTRLGDIVHAGPVYVGAPNLGWGDTAPFPSTTGELYSEFAEITRESVVYVGSNDGMLHAFKTSNGNEEFAYIPNMLFSSNTGAGLHYLTEATYMHHYYVDMTPSVSDAYVNGDWKTILVGAMRSGARGLFALDVTHPESFGTSSVLGEFTSADDANLGYTFSRPVILMTNAENASGEKRWAAIFGNGINSGGTGRPALFVVFLDVDLSDGWTEGSTTTSDYRRLDIPTDTAYGDTTTPNGLSSPAVLDIFDTAGAVGSNGTVDRAYAGDMKGNLWGFDISDTNPANWGVLHSYRRGSTTYIVPLFTATNQPITSSPVVVRNPADTAELIVMFGTGRYITSGDPSDTSAMGFYGVYDDLTRYQQTTADLQVQTLSLDASGFRTITDTALGGSKHGWYIPLSGGERVITDPAVRGGIVYFNTTIPSGDACTAGGSGWLMSVDYINGGVPDSPIFDRNGDNVVNDSDLISGAAPVGKAFDQGIPASSTMLGNRRYTPGTQSSNGGDIQDDQIQDLGGGNTGRLSWEELKPASSF